MMDFQKGETLYAISYSDKVYSPERVRFVESKGKGLASVVDMFGNVAVMHVSDVYKSKADCQRAAQELQGDLR